MSYLSDFQELNGRYVAFGGNPKGGKISGKGKIKTGKLDFEDVYFVKELKFNLFSVSQICDKKNKVLFTDFECLVLSPDFKLPDESQVLLRVPRENNMYNVNLKDIVPFGDLTCLFAKATIDESNLWHRTLGHINFKTINKLLKGNLVRGLPTKVFENHNTCVAYKKGKQYRASCKTNPVSSVNQPLFRLHMDLFGPTFVKSLNKKNYFLVITDDYSRFTWVFFLATNDETSPTLKNFITGPENQLSLKVKVIRSDNRTEFKNSNLYQFCRIKGIQREFSVPRTPQQNGIGPTWRFDIDSLTKTMNYQPLTAGNQTNPCAGFKDTFDANKVEKEANLQYVLFPVWSTGSSNPQNKEGDFVFDEKEHNTEKPESVVNLSPSKIFKDFSEDSSNDINAAGPKIPTARQNYSISTNPISVVGPSNSNSILTHGQSSIRDTYQPLDMVEKEYIVYSNHENVGAEADFNNLETPITVSPILTTRIHNAHPISQIIGNLSSTTQTRSMARITRDQGGISQILNEDFYTWMFACFLLQEEPKRVHQALKDPSWIKAMQEELLQFKMQSVWILVDLPHRKRAIGHIQEEGFNYEEVFAPVAIIEAIRLFLVYASFMGFMVYQMDVKSAFLYGSIEEEVYVCQPLGFKDPDHHDKVYKVVKALYGLHQAPRAWYETLATYLLENGFHRGQIDQTLFIKKQKRDILLVQIYVDDIIFGATNKDLCKSFEKLTKDKFHMSSMGELTFFLGLQVKQKEDGIFINHDKYVVEILQKFRLTEGKSTSSPIDTEKPLLKDLMQIVVATSSTDAEYVAGVSCCAQVLWIQNQTLDYGMVAYLSKSDASEGLDQIIDFINGSYIAYALTVSPTIYVSCIKQFWRTVVVKSSNDVTRLQALVDKKGVVGSEEEQGNADTTAEEPETVVPEDTANDQNIPSPTLLTQPPQQSQDEALDTYAALARGVEHLEQDKLRRLRKVGTSQKVDTSDDTLMEDADIYHIDMDHATKVLSMQEDESEVQEAVEVVTNAKLIIEVIAAVSETVSVAAVIPSVVPETISAAAITTIIAPPIKESSAKTPTETTSKDKGKGILVEEPKPIKKKQQVEMDEAAIATINETLAQKAAKRRKLIKEAKEAESIKQHLQIVTNEDDDVFTEATPLARKVPVVDYQIILVNNKPRYKIIKADDTHQLYASFITMLKNFNREDLDTLWRIVKERFSTSKPNNFLDEYLLTALKMMFERPDGQDNYINRYQGMKKRPQTESEARKNMMIYLKNTAGYKMDFFKGMTYAQICLIFQARFDENIRFLFKSREEIEEEDQEVIKSINETPAQKATKRRKLSEEAQEAEDPRKRLEVVDDEDDDVFIKATPLARKVPVVDYHIVLIDNKPRLKIIKADETHQLYISFTTLLKNFDREDLENL
nr:putative ribonuclease H-like domain-containing protein [Tanacetum cinerariifolium]